MQSANSLRYLRIKSACRTFEPTYQGGGIQEAVVRSSREIGQHQVAQLLYQRASHEVPRRGNGSFEAQTERLERMRGIIINKNLKKNE